MTKLYANFLVFLSVSTFSFSFSFELLPLEKLVATGKVSVQFIAAGGYQDECMQMIVKNYATDSVYGFIEPGRKLNSLNDAEQDILVVKATQFSLRKNQTDTISVTGFCCESTKASPSKGSLFSIGILAPAAWLIIANLVNLHPFSSDAIQHSIWVLSDKHDIRSIPAYSNPAMDQLRYAVADILDIELPWYSFLYKSDGVDLFSGTKTHFFAQVPFILPERALVAPQVTTPAGEVIYTGEASYFRAGENVITVKIPIDFWPEAEYDLHIIEDFHTTNKKLRFDLGE